ncbi:exopolysaccharide biosynthesis polyprenyl glycosylphosphotransferase [Sphingomonas sp.]|jgi:polysaccharide biosynthesis protein PslA|uniref:exopolysaccharide biosynthesis polyprenyl glycosylphosphotransferase n=1 Tax=Sphingomonas sp. TaxID=28214 RepID=UPI00258DF4C2|nr:exopolysaccharide biosynthesis polyprenyl glycosylphosphotransferase [Sphingomonas sp.]
MPTPINEPGLDDDMNTSSCGDTPSCDPDAMGSVRPIQDMERQRIIQNIVLMGCDVGAIMCGFIIANAAYLNDALATHGVTMLSVLVPIYLWTALVNGSYGAHVLADPRKGIAKAMQALVFAAAAMLIIAYSFKAGAAFSRFVFWIGLTLSLTMVVTLRIAATRLIFRRADRPPFNVVVIIDGVQRPVHPHETCIDVARIGFDPTTDDPLHYDRLAKLVGNADRVLVSCHGDHTAAWAHVLKSMAVDGEVIADDPDHIGIIGVSTYGDRRTLVVSAGPLHLRERTIKRIFDIVTSATALLVLLPLFIAVAIAIRLESPGPILFRQQRIGRDNALFMMFKFRSMYTDRTDATANVLTSRNDNRVTRVGQFIRRNSIDELPQLLNVLRGEMSMVGPRPHALSAKAAERLYWEIDQRYRHRHTVKPGVTGLAQVRGFRGATVETSDLTNRLASDLEYVQDWSMRKDLWILFRTIFVIRHENAF